MRSMFVCVTLLSGLLLVSSPALAHNGKDDAASHESDSNSGKGNSKSNNGLALGQPVRFRTKLSAGSGVETSAKGHADFRNKVGKKVSEARLTAGLHIPVPSTVPAMATADQAKLFTLTLSRAGTAFATCTFAFDHVSTNSAGLSSTDFKLDVRSRTFKGATALQNKKGTCDIDLATAGEQQGLPAVQKGDSLSVSDETGVAFVQGSF